MSTRCNIIVKDQFNDRIYLYHHFDGYPEGVGADLKKFFDQYQKWQIQQHGVFLANKLVKNTAGLDDEGYEITTGLHGDIEYLYVINCKAGTLRCYEVPFYLDREDRMKNIATRRHIRNL